MNASSGLLNQLCGSRMSLRDIFKDSRLRLFSGVIPVNANGAETGMLIATITTNGATTKARQRIRITPAVGTATRAVWNVVLNGITISFTDDGTPTAAEICTGLFNAIRAATGVTPFTTPHCSLNIPTIHQMFTLTDNVGTLDIEAAVAGVSFEHSLSVTGAGAGTGSMTATVLQDSLNGLRFEPFTAVSDGILEKLATDAWSGRAITAGTVTYGRLVQDGDTGTLSTTEPRVQGLVAVANADIVLSHVDLAVNEVVNVTSFSLRIS